MNIYAGKLSREVTEDDLQQAFEAFGEVTSVRIVKDRFSNESKGFGFIEMPRKNEALSAIANLNDKDLKGSVMIVNEAKPRTDNRSGGGRNFHGRDDRGGQRRW